MMSQDLYQILDQTIQKRNRFSSYPAINNKVVDYLEQYMPTNDTFLYCKTIGERNLVYLVADLIFSDLEWVMVGACNKNHFPTAKALITNYGYVPSRDDIVHVCRDGSIEFVKFLLKTQSTFNDWNAALNQACRGTNDAVVEFTLSMGATECYNCHNLLHFGEEIWMRPFGQGFRDNLMVNLRKEIVWPYDGP